MKSIKILKKYMNKDLIFAIYYFILGLIAGGVIFAVLFAIQHTSEANAQVSMSTSIKEGLCNSNIEVIRECCSGVK